jgi:hypothetical protein
VVLVLKGVTLDPVQRRNFLIWLCKAEQFVAYAYGTPVKIAEDRGRLVDAYDIYASSPAYDVAETIGADEMADGKYRITDRHHAILAASLENGIFFGL